MIRHNYLISHFYLADLSRDQIQILISRSPKGRDIRIDPQIIHFQVCLKYFFSFFADQHIFFQKFSKKLLTVKIFCTAIDSAFFGCC